MLLCFRKQHVLPRLFIRNLCRDEMNYFDTRDCFFFSDRKSEAMKLVKIVHSPPSKLSYTWAMYYKFNK